MSDLDRMEERRGALEKAWRQHAERVAELELRLTALTRRDERVPVLQELRFAESEMARIGGLLVWLERSPANGPAPARNRRSQDLSSPCPTVGSPIATRLDDAAADLRGEPGLIDLEIRVRREVRHGQNGLTYVLNSPLQALDFRDREIAGPVLEPDPETYQNDLIGKIEELGRALGPEQELLDQSEVEQDLVRLGQDLYLRLFPREMRSAYLELREHVRTVRITSDEPWIPWELVCPFEKAGRDGKPVADDFLCARYQLTRWLSGTRPPAESIHVQRLACVEAGTVTGLPVLRHAREELGLLQGLAAGHPGVGDASLPDAMSDQVGALLEQGGFQLLHFTGHGDFGVRQPDDAKIELCDKRSLRARALHGMLTVALARERPFVFLNACRVGQLGRALTGLGGWAEGWVRRAEAGGFLAPQWTVRDGLACRFAEAFYDALSLGQSFGSAVHQARQRARALAPGNPTWLAYTLYASPGGRLTWPAVAGG